MALPCDRDLQGLANPPGRVRRQTSAMADVETINRLHQTANGFLQEVGITQCMMTKTLRHVSGQADVRGRQAVLAMHVAIMHAAHGRMFARVAIAVIADELRHWPRFMNGTMSAEFREVADQVLDEFCLTFPEGGKKLAFFFGSEEIGGKDRL